MRWTKEQEQAIYSSGHDILVSAAAGSGKTAVLVERIIQKVLAKEDPVDIDSLLVVTFTNAAAQEMRNRVGQALEAALETHPTSQHLKKQVSLLQRAPISTLHSFCMDVVRKYAYLLDIDPAFRIADDMEVDLIKQDVIDELFEEWYGLEGEEQKRFFDIVDRFSNDRSDVDVETLILDLYTFSRQHPWPDHWLEQLIKLYDIPETYREEQLDWLMMMKEEVNHQFLAMEQEISLAEEISRESDGPYHYLDTLSADRELLQKAKDRMDHWDDLQAYMASSSFVRLSGKRIECNEDKKEEVKKLRNQYRKRWTDMKNNWFSRPLANHLSDLRELAPAIKYLVSLVKQFADRYNQYKREQAIVDFADLEHLCLQLLLDESSTIDKPQPSSVARSLQQQFHELLVDEYQDTNLVQETILTLISDQSGPGNMFMVGDVKQSIYRFRHAEPSLFIHKYNEFKQGTNESERIDLSRNFRSRKHILAGANFIFRQILDEELGEINYDREAELIYGNNMYDDLPIQDPYPELVIINRDQAEVENDNSDNDETYQDLEKAQLEARAYGQKIKQWIGHAGDKPLQVVDSTTDNLRDIQYRDIVILLRSMTWAPVIVEELKKQGIPVYAELSTGYFAAIEIQVMLSLLKVIDNPRQDIPLAAVLRSPLVDLNEEELAQVRLADQGQDYYDALQTYLKLNDNETTRKITRFMKQLEQFRRMAREGALSDLIWEIYRETGYYDFVGGIPGGRQRQANLRALYDRARSYEATSFRGLFRFLRFIERMEERGDDLGAARALSEQEDVVRIMTIHKSKGLEFPVVIMGGLDHQFNLRELNDKYLLDKELGFATKYIDPVKRITYPTLYFHAVRQKKLREQLSEEIRVLYVALTRAKEKLVMVGNVASFAKKLEKWQQIINHQGTVLPTYLRLEARSYLDWVGPALIRHRDHNMFAEEERKDQPVIEEIYHDPSRWKVEVFHASELANLDESITTPDKRLKTNIVNWKPLSLADDELSKLVDERLSFTYPYEIAVSSRAKQTVTEIKRQREIADEYSSQEFLRSMRAPITKRPQFMQTKKQVTPAERGTIIHTVMQHLPFSKPLNQDEIRDYISLLVQKEMITEEQAETIDVTMIENFLTTNIAQYMMSVDHFYREVPFSLSLPASEIYPDWPRDKDERVLIQGVIDCLIPKDDGWIILDYKTDQIPEEVTDAEKKRLAQRYETQMSLYRRAIEEIWQQKVVKTYLYYLDKQLLIEV